MFNLPFEAIEDLNGQILWLDHSYMTVLFLPLVLSFCDRNFWDAECVLWYMLHNYDNNNNIPVYLYCWSCHHVCRTELPAALCAICTYWKRNKNTRLIYIFSKLRLFILLFFLSVKYLSANYTHVTWKAWNSLKSWKSENKWVVLEKILSKDNLKILKDFKRFLLSTLCSLATLMSDTLKKVW